MQRTLTPNITRVMDQSGWLVTLMLLIDSLHFVFARLLVPHIGPEISALYVQGISAVIFGLYALRTGQLDWRVAHRHFWFFLTIGLLVALSTNIGYSAIQYIDPATASMLSKVSTLFGVALGLFWLRERFNQWQWLGALLAMIGSFVVAYHPGSDLQSQAAQVGSLLVLFATFLYAIHAAVVKRYGGGIDFINFFFFRLLSTTLCLLVLAAYAGVLTVPPATAWLWICLIGTVDVVISRVLYYVALRRLNMSIHTLLLTLSPVATILWSFLLFHSLPGLQELLGGLTVMTGVMLVTWQQGRS
jgi:drug/metabolite transporter (DMT)-like permease